MRAHIEYGTFIFGTTEQFKPPEFPFTRWRDKDSIRADISMGRCAGIVDECKSYLQRSQYAGPVRRRLRQTDILCNPQRSQSSRSRSVLDDHEGSTDGKGRTCSVMIYRFESDSTASMNFRTSGCLVVRSLLKAFNASGFVFRFEASVKSNSKIETGDPSSCAIWALIHMSNMREAHSLRPFV